MRPGQTYYKLSHNKGLYLSLSTRIFNRKAHISNYIQPLLLYVL